MRKLLMVIGAGVLGKKLYDRQRASDPVARGDRAMRRRGMPGGVRP